MALRLIRQANETVRLDVAQGTGWQPAGRGQLDASSNAHPELATVQATGCTGLRVYDYDAPGQPYWESTTGTSHTVTVIKTGRRLAVRAANTTDDTEVIMHVVPIPPPYFVGLLRAWRGGRRGVDTDRFTRWRGTDRQFRPGGFSARLPELGHRAGSRHLGKQPDYGYPTARVVPVPLVDQREPDCLPGWGGATGRLRSPSERGYASPGYRHGVPRHGTCERALQGGQTRGIPHGTHTHLAPQGVGC